MESNLLVSIIIPAYNTSEYIGRMLQCVCQQTYKNIEVIVIDDGSTDKTCEVVKNMMKKNDFIHLIELPHGGVSAARNAGIEQAQGEKIFFWDSDDSMEPETIADCLEFAEKHAVNAVLYGYANRVNGIKEHPHESILRKVYRDREIVTDLMPHFLGHSFEDINNWIKGKHGLRYGKENTALWHIMLDATTIKKKHLRFDTNLSLGEDTRFINEYMLYETSIGFLNKCLYYLTMRESGANLTSMNNAQKRLADKLKLIDARNEIDAQALKLYQTNTNSFWEGTLVLSVIEMAMRLASSSVITYKRRYELFKHFLSNPFMHRSISEFNPANGLRSLPFLILKYGKAIWLFYLFTILPDKIVKRMVRV